MCWRNIINSQRLKDLVMHMQGNYINKDQDKSRIVNRIKERLDTTMAQKFY